MLLFRRLDRYIWAEMQAPFFLGLAGFTFAILLNKLFALVAVTIEKKVPVHVILGLLTNELPGIFLFTLPIATILSVLVGIGRLAAQGEITAFRAAGISPLRLFVPVMVFAAAASAVAVWVAHDLEPASYPRRKALVQEVQRSRDPAREIEPGTFYMRLPGAVFYARSASESAQGRVFHGIFLQLERPTGPAETIVANRGRIVFDRETGRISLLLDDGEVHDPPSDPAGVYQRTIFPRLTRSFPADLAFREFTKVAPTAVQSARWGALPAELGRLKSTLDALKASKARPHKVEQAVVELRRARIAWYRRLAFPLGGLVLAFAAFPLAIPVRRGGRFAGLSRCLLLLITYYAIATAADGPTEKGTWAPWVGPFLPIVILGSLGVVSWVGVLSSLRLVRSPAAWIAQLFDLPRRTLDRWRTTRRRRAAGAPRESAVLQRIEVQERRQNRGPSGGPGRIVDRYLVGGYLRFTALVLVVLALLGFIIEFKAGFESIPFNATSVPVAEILTFATLTLPGQLRYLLPLAALFGAAIALSVLARAGELVALKAAGIGPVRIALPILVVTGAACVLFGVAQETVIPVAERTAERAKAQIEGRPTVDPASSGRRWLVGDAGRIWSFVGWEPSSARLVSPAIVEADLDRGRVVRTLVAASAERATDATWRWQDATIRTFPDGANERFERRESTSLTLAESPEMFGGGSDSLFGRREADQLSVRELRASVELLARAGSPVGPLRVRVYERLLLPFLPLLLVPPGIALIASGWSRRTTLFGFIVALGIAIAFWTTWAITTSLGREAMLSPLVAAGAVPILTGAIGGLMLARAR